MADGTTFEIDVGVQADGVGPAAAALASLADRLSAAGAASTAAADAVKAGEASYAQAETAADRAAKAVERIGLAADAQRGKLQEALDVGDAAGVDRAAAKLDALTQRQAEAAAKADATKSALDEEAASLDQLRQAAAAAAANEDQLSKAQENAETSAKGESSAAESTSEGTGNTRALASALGALGGPLGVAGQKGAAMANVFGKLSKTLGAAGPYVGAAVVIAAIGTAAVVATLSIAKWAVGLADASRTQGLLNAGIAHSVQGGEELSNAISDISKKVPLSTDELQSMASNLASTGLRGKALTDALDAAAVKAATLKLGPDFAKGLLSLDVQANRLKDNLTGKNGIFSGLKIEGLLQGISKIIALFDSTSDSGKAIKVVFESMFQPIIDGLTSLGPKIISTFIQFEIWVLKALIKLQEFHSTFVVAGEIAVGAAKVIGIALAVVTVVVLAILAATVAFVGVLLTLPQLGEKAGTAIREAFVSILAKGQELVDYLSGLSLAEIGTQLIEGLANGITAGGAAVLKSITGVVGGAIDGAKSLLGIHSPSKVFAEIGAHTAEGMAGGVDDNAGAVQGSLESMVSPPDAKGGSGGSNSSGGAANFSGATFNLYGVEGADDAVTRIGGLLTSLLEGDSAQLGGAVPST